MAEPKLTKIEFAGGVWRGELTGAGGETPQLQVTYLGEAIDGLQVTHDAARGVWHVAVTVPPSLIGDGVQTLVISDAAGRKLESFALLAGDALAEDIRAEVDLLRSELDLLKRSFRRHCSGTE